MRRLSLCLAASTFAGLLPARAANVGPELSQALPSLTLASGAASAPVPLTDHLRDPDVPSAVRITVRLGTQTAQLHLALHDTEAPLTVANFKNYITSGRYAENFFHRSVPGFILQTGGFKFANNSLSSVPAFPPVLNEPGRSNLRGTLAMAKLGGDPDSATNQWFINLADNSANLDSQNGGFTVFGRVLGDGMVNIVDVLASVPLYDLRPAPFGYPWDEIPLSRNPFSNNTLYRQDFIETNAALISPLTYQVTSDAPDLVAVTLADGVLSLAASSTLAGTTTIRLTATDLEGAALQASFPVTVLSSDPLVAWRQTHFATLDNAGPAADTADPDGDGLANLLEYALGGDPTSPASAPLPIPSLLPAPDSLLRLSYVHARADLTYTVQTTTDLATPASWTATGVTQGTPAPDGAVTATIPHDSPRRFLRLHVTRP